MLMPALTKGSTYKWTDREIANAIAPGDDKDFLESQCHPIPLQNKQIVLEYAEFSVNDLSDQLDKLSRLYIGICDRAKVEKIKTLIQEGAKACPVFIDKDDATKRIQIGNHRAIAFFELSTPTFPVFLFKYAE